MTFLNKTEALKLSKFPTFIERGYVAEPDEENITRGVKVIVRSRTDHTKYVVAKVTKFGRGITGDNEMRVSDGEFSWRVSNWATLA